MLKSFFALLLLVFAHSASAGAPELLEPEQAFRFAARVIAPDALEVRYQVAPGYYLYRDKFRFTVAPHTVELGPPELPAGAAHKDAFFGEVQTYRGELRIRLPLRNAEHAPSITLSAVSQGCADAGVCYVPHEQQARLTLTAGAPSFSPPAAAALPQGFFAGGADALAGDDRAIEKLFEAEVALLIMSFFGFGLLLAFTPCVLPMIPILSAIIAGRGSELTRLRGFLLSAAYVLGMAITYAAAGVLAGLSGAMLSSALQNPWVIGAFALVFVALAGAMFGFYELQLPSRLQGRLTNAAGRLHGGHFAGVFGMGALSALIVGPCVAAPLAGALLYISQSRDVVLGGSALFAMAIGMGVPLLAVGASAGALLPKAGPWMHTVKAFFGVLLLAVAIYLVAPFVPVVVQMLAWAALLIVAGVHAHAVDPLPPGARGFQRLTKAVGMIALVAGIAFLVGALAGGRDPLQPLAGLRPATSDAESPPVTFVRVSSSAELDGVLASAAGRPVMLDFYADWCVTCKEMERYTLSDRQVRSRLASMLKIQADVTANTAEHQALLRRFRLFGPPGIVFFDRQGREIPALRVIGFQPAARFAAVLDRVLVEQ